VSPIQHFDPWDNVSALERLYLPLRYFYVYSYALRAILRMKQISKCVQNWYALPFLRLGLSEAELKLRSGRTVRVKNFAEWRERRRSIMGECLAEEVREAFLSKFNLDFSDPDFYEVFVEEPYRNVDVEGKVVIDVGAFVGDSPIYFALRGAKHVHAFEPFPSHYELALNNIKRLKLEDRITLHRAGIGCTRSTAIITKSGVEGVREIGAPQEGGVPTEVITLEDAARLAGGSDMVLKVDCEGCEYGALLCSDSATLRRFSYIAIEYHYGYKNIVERLEKEGFSVEYTRPALAYLPGLSNPLQIVGYIFARRRD